MQFIYSNPNALSADYCNKVINLFEQSPLKQRGQFRLKDEVIEKPDVKSSTDITFTPQFLNDPQWGPYLKHLVNVVEENLINYTFRFKQAFEKMDDFRIDSAFNIQRYEPEEGFYGWHCERAGLLNSNRVLVFMVYLNTVNDGGETQFYHQGHLEKPTQGKLLIWPSDWTHTHRGIPSLTEKKYIFTGWFTHYKND
jgi:hypothetical protein